MSSRKNKSRKNQRTSEWKLEKILTPAIVLPLIAALIIAFLTPTFDHSATEETVKELNANMISGFESVTESLDSISQSMSKPSAINSAVSYETGKKLYQQHRYEDAAACFSRAVSEQADISGAESVEVGHVYCMLGLSRIYAGHVISDDGNDAITALYTALHFFELNDITYDVACCYHFIAVAYFETGYDHLSIATENVKNSMHALDSDQPDNTAWLVVTVKGQELRFFTDTYNYELIYQNCKSFKLTRDNYNLLGKIWTRRGDSAKAFYFFNMALKMDAYLLNADYSLATCDLSDQVEIENEEIKDYLNGATIGSILDSALRIEVWNCRFNNDTVEFDLEDHSEELVYSSSDTATLLTNRAMSEVGLGLYSNAITDCESALSIWDTLSFSEQANISYTYNYLAIACLGEATDGFKLSDVSEDKKPEIMNYINKAVSHDKELYGSSHPRIAYFLETKGFISFLCGEIDTSLQSYYDSHIIYRNNHDEISAEFVKEQMKEIYNTVYDDSISFEEWLDSRS